MNNKLIFTLFCVFVFLSCVENKKAQVSDIPVLKVSDLKAVENLELDDTSYFDKVEFIKLETTDESILGEISQIEVFENHIYILDRKGNSLKKIDLAGKYLHDIGKVGLGTEEYVAVSAFYINPNIAGFLFIISSLQVNAQSVHFKEENSIRMMSYNVRNCTGMDNVVDYQRIADIINRTSPDVVALQELDSATVRSGGVSVLKELAERTLMYQTYAPAIDFQGGKYGIGILSKEKPIGFKQIPLPGNEKRMLLAAEFSRYFFCCTHLALEQENRERSVSIILETVKDIHKPLFLAGDMNATYNSPELKALNEKFTLLSDSRKNTFPADKPNQCIDFIFGIKNNGYSVLGQRVLNESKASDHLPLYVDVRLKASVENIFRIKPYLQNPVDNGITISWFTNVPVESWVEYGTDGKTDQKQAFLKIINIYDPMKRSILQYDFSGKYIKTTKSSDFDLTFALLDIFHSTSKKDLAGFSRL